MTRIFIAACLWCVAGVWAAAAAQQGVVTGTVLDARTEQPLAGVLVFVEGQPSSTQTDREGRFTLELPPGRHTLAASIIGYAMVQQAIEVQAGAPVQLIVRLPEGAGAFTEKVTVTGKVPDEAGRAPAGAALHGRELQALRGVMLDDPLRAAQALPSATSTDDLYSEFAVRGSPFRQVGLAVDGIPTRYLMHTVHGVTDGGSIAMVNSETLGAVSLLPGSYAQRTGRRLGAHLELTTREGNREEFRGRAGLSGTSANVLTEGPLTNGRGSWLASVRRSYLDYLIKRIDEEASFVFGFTDAQTKVVYDITPRHQLQALAMVGRSDFDENPEDLGANDEALSHATSWLSSMTWRYTPTPRLVLSPRVYVTGVDFNNLNRNGESLDQGRSVDVGWRFDGSFVASDRWLLEFGGDAQRLSSRHRLQRTLDGTASPTVLSDYSEKGSATSAYALVTTEVSRVRVAPGVRIDRWSPTHDVTASPWVTVDAPVAPRTRLRLGTGIYRQFPQLDQVFGINGGGPSLRPERAVHADAGLEYRFTPTTFAQATWYMRDESGVLFVPAREPRRLAPGVIQLGRGDAPWLNALDGRARGIEFVLRREAPQGLSGWAGYAYGRHRYTQTLTGETFWGDVDQRHSLSLYGNYRLSGRTSVGAKFRYGSNYPIVGYIGEQPVSPNAPGLLGGAQPVFYRLVGERNTLRLPAYARLDLRADRAFTWASRRLTLFVEVANALNRTNVRSAGYGVSRDGRVFDATDSLMPIVPSAGFVVEF